ncbi:MAG: TPM domain-containing protein [Cytophagaceae bacterium]|nr:TPM domain-containing protein [Cytophagaceae bacterium]
MKRKFLLFFTLVFINSGIWAQDIPAKPSPPKLVNDFVGGLLSDAQIQQLERKLVAYNDSTSTQVIIVIVKSTQPMEAADYAIELGRKWGVGQKDKNNGLVLLWAPGDRKITIQTGYGMEGAIPDIYAKRIISTIIAPNFKELKYFEGLDQATDAIIKYASGEYQAEPEEEGDGLIFFIILVVLIIFILWIIGRNSKGGGGNKNKGNSAWPYTVFTGWGSQSGNWGGGGSSWGGGGSSWGSGGGGGFGGFGGGSFGGGGASGDY